MPLPEKTLAEIKKRVDEAKAKIAELEDVITDLRASGIDASKQEARLQPLKDELRKWELFYGYQEERQK